MKKIASLAAGLGYRAFLVGGSVRDVFLGRPNPDLDIVIEGDAIRLGHILSSELDASFVSHKRFGTCTLVTKDKLRIDLATARSEKYERPGILPTVKFSSVKDDLVRRDFTINAMAVSINKDDFGKLIDFFGGLKDLKAGRIKVIHDRSFMDDPTRIFRAIRFEQRFGFHIDKHTQGLIDRAIECGMLERLETQRVRKEVLGVMREDEPMKILERLGDFIHAKVLIRKVL